MKDLPSIPSQDAEPAWRPLHQAIYDGELEKVSTLLSEGANWRETLLKKGEIDNGPRGKQLYTNSMNALEVAVARQSPETISCILSYAAPIIDDERVLKAFNKSKGFPFFQVQLAFLSFSNAKITESIEQDIIALSKTACDAISATDRDKLRACFRRTELCLQVSGKTSPLHHALREGKYGFLRVVYFDHIIDSIGSDLGKTLNDSERSQCMIHGGKQLEELGPHVYDEYQRSFSFRLEREQRKAVLDRELATPNSWFERYKTFNRLSLYQAQRVQIAIADQWHLKMTHSAKIQNNAISKLGQFALAAIRPFSILATAGVPRYALHFAWTQGMSYTKQYVFKKLNEVHPYAPYIVSSLDNFLTFCLVPEYYVASTVLGSGVYYAFKDSGYDNAEAVAQLVVDGAVYSATVGSKSSYEVDERYQYHLNNKISAVFGEKAANMMTPIIAGVDSISNQANRAINGAVTSLNNYFSQSSVAQLTEFVSLPENLSSVASYAKSGIDRVRSLQETWLQVEQRILNEFEAPLVGLMNDSTFKQNRLHALALFESHRLLAQLSEMNQQFEMLKSESQSADLQTAEEKLAKQQAAVDAATAEAERLFKLTEGYAYHETWQSAYADLKIQEYQKHANPTVIAGLREKEQAALAKSRFYNNDIVNQVNELWAKDLDELMNLSKDNFLDNTNIVSTITTLIGNAFSYSTNNPNQRNEIAKHCADEIIRYRYPYYPSIGDKGTIEAERQAYLNEISSVELKGYPGNRGRIERRLYDYIYAKISGTPKKPHISRFKSASRTFLNEVIGKTIGYIPYPEHKGGRSERGNIGIQFSKNGNQKSQVNVAVNNIPVVNVHGGSQKSTMELSLPKPVVKESIAVSSQSVPISKISTVSTQGARTKLALDNPYLKPILDEQFEQTFTMTKSTPRGKVQPHISTAKTGKTPRTKIAPVKAANDAVSFLPVIKSKAKLDPWWEMALRSSRGDVSKDVRNWRKSNQLQAPEWVMAAAKVISHRSMELADVPVILSEAFSESLIESVESLYAVGQFSVDELGRLLRGETLQTKRAVLIVGSFIGQEAARVMLSEKTETSKYIHSIAAEFDSLDSKGKTKALSKIALAIFLPSLGFKLANQSGKMVVQRVSTAVAAKQAKTAKHAPHFKVASNKEIVPKTFSGAVKGTKQPKKAAPLLAQYERNRITRNENLRATLFNRLTSDSLSKLAKPFDDALVKSMEKKGWTVVVAKEGSDEYRYLIANGVEASFNPAVPKHLVIIEGGTKSALLEEFLHGTQTDLGLKLKYSLDQELEVHVKDFMLRHAKILGLDNPDDIRLLQQLKLEEIERLDKILKR